jgi:RNA polymerase sigma-70 factor (ECF subfamily)
VLASVLPTPVVLLNRAVAVGERDGASAGLAAVDAVSGLDRFHLWHAARADLLRRLGRRAEAAAAYEAALACEPSEPEQRFLRRRLSEVGGA